MNNHIFKLMKNIYYFSLTFLCIVYLFPGSLIGFLLYGDLGKQPNFIENPFGTSINHLIYFFFITTLATLIKSRVKNIFTNYRNILLISCVLEILHLIVPNRAFELYDLIANVIGVVLVILINKLIKS